jgi:hypothetical protein
MANGHAMSKIANPNSLKRKLQKKISANKDEANQSEYGISSSAMHSSKLLLCFSAF